MKSIKTILCIILSLSLLFSLCACLKSGEDTDKPANDDSSIVDKGDDEKGEDDEEGKDDGEKAPESEDGENNDVTPPEKKKAYSVVLEYEPSSAGAELKAVENPFTKEHHPLGIVMECSDEGVLLVDYNGEAKVSLPDSEYGYCPVCRCITDHVTKIDPFTLETSEHWVGHGYSSTVYYYYNEESGELFSEIMGGWPTPCDTPEGAVVVKSAKARPATDREEQLYGVDTLYEAEEKYGILIDGTLAVPMEYDGAGGAFERGICTLSKDGLWGAFTDKGEELYPCEYTEIGKVCYGLIPLCKDGMWAYGNTRGSTVTDFEFERALPAYNNLAYVKFEDGWKIISFKNEYQGIPEFEAKHLVEDYLQGLGYYASVDTNLAESDVQTTMYLAEGYCFESEVLHLNGNRQTLYHFVFTDGTIIGYLA